MSQTPVMDTREVVADHYRSFAEHEAAATSPTLHDWALAVANDDALLALIATLPPGKRQPNLVLAAARVHGALPGNVASLRGTLLPQWSRVQETIATRSTQTNEAARCASLLVALRSIAGPIALLEVGASAGLRLVPDRYSYVFNRETRLDPVEGPSDLVIPISLTGGLTPPAAMPERLHRRRRGRNHRPRQERPLHACPHLTVYGGVTYPCRK